MKQPLIEQYRSYADAITIGYPVDTTIIADLLKTAAERLEMTECQVDRTKMQGVYTAGLQGRNVERPIDAHFYACNNKTCPGPMQSINGKQHCALNGKFIPPPEPNDIA